MRKSTMALVAGMVFWGFAVGLVLHATGRFFVSPNLIMNVTSTVLVSVLYTIGMLFAFRPKIEPGQELKAFFFPIPAFLVLAAWAALNALLR